MYDADDIHLLDVEGVLNLPDPGWLITGILPEGDYSVMWGPSRQGKSFVALEWAYSLALGRPWQGYTTQRTPVVYIAAEGGRGIKKRIQALMARDARRDVPGLYFLVEPLYVREPGAVEAFLERLEREDIFPGLVVIDTLSRSFGGGEENASDDMGYFVDAVSALAKGRSMTVLVIHHSNATGGRERGSTILRCGANAMFECKGDIDKDTNRLSGVFLKNDKQKDDGEAEEIYLRTMPCGASLVLEKVDIPPERRKKRGASRGDEKPMRKVDMLHILAAAEDGGYGWREWWLRSHMPKHTFNYRVRQLMNTGEIYKDDDGKYMVMPSTKDLAALETE